MQKLVKDLRSGDRVELEGGVGVITRAVRSCIMESAPGLGGAYEIEWKDGSETGQMIVSGLASVQLSE